MTHDTHDGVTTYQALYEILTSRVVELSVDGPQGEAPTHVVRQLQREGTMLAREPAIWEQPYLIINMRYGGVQETKHLVQCTSHYLCAGNKALVPPFSLLLLLSPSSPPPPLSLSLFLLN